MWKRKCTIITKNIWKQFSDIKARKLRWLWKRRKARRSEGRCHGIEDLTGKNTARKERQQKPSPEKQQRRRKSRGGTEGAEGRARDQHNGDAGHVSARRTQQESGPLSASREDGPRRTCRAAPWPQTPSHRNREKETSVAYTTDWASQHLDLGFLSPQNGEK